MRRIDELGQSDWGQDCGKSALFPSHWPLIQRRCGRSPVTGSVILGAEVLCNVGSTSPCCKAQTLMVS
jgi:hypothetical protein